MELLLYATEMSGTENPTYGDLNIFLDEVWF